MIIFDEIGGSLSEQFRIVCSGKAQLGRAVFVNVANNFIAVIVHPLYSF